MKQEFKWLEQHLYYMPLKKDNDFLPNLELIPEEIADQAEDDDFKLPRESRPSNGSCRFL